MDKRLSDSKVMKVIEKSFWLIMALVVTYMVIDGFNIILAVTPK
jgi:hypothetical protein